MHAGLDVGLDEGLEAGPAGLKIVVEGAPKDTPPILAGDPDTACGQQTAGNAPVRPTVRPVRLAGTTRAGSDPCRIRLRAHGGRPSPHHITFARLGEGVAGYRPSLVA